MGKRLIELNQIRETQQDQSTFLLIDGYDFVQSKKISVKDFINLIKAKYTNVDFIEINELCGVLTAEQLSDVKASKINPIILNGSIFKLSVIERNIYKYINTSANSNSKDPRVRQIKLDINTGEYCTIELDGVIQKIQYLNSEINTINAKLSNKVAVQIEQITTEEPEENYKLKIYI